MLLLEVEYVNALGLVVEYNPFHNGHLYHLQQSKSITNADVTIAVMSGNFLQRGEPALVDKWTRTAMALDAGIDLVIELPFIHAVQKAEYFSEAAILLLEEVGCQSVCFGSEQGQIDPFIHTYTIIQENSKEIDQLIQHYSKEGYSYPKAASLAYSELQTRFPSMLSLDQPNNILGFHYVSAILKHKLSIVPVTIKRTGSGYHDPMLMPGKIASATGIRKELMENGNLNAVSPFVPETTLTLLQNYMSGQQLLHHWELYWPFLKIKLITTPPEALSHIYEMKEGLENRLIEAAERATSFMEFMSFIKTKRYTWTRLQRILTYTLLNFTKSEMPESLFPPYIRVLGFNRTGQQYSKSIKKEKGSLFVSRLAASHNPIIDIDKRAAIVHAAVLSPSNSAKAQKREYMAPIVLSK